MTERIDGQEGRKRGHLDKYSHEWMDEGTGGGDGGECGCPEDIRLGGAMLTMQQQQQRQQ